MGDWGELSSAVLKALKDHTLQILFALWAVCVGVGYLVWAPDSWIPISTARSFRSDHGAFLVPAFVSLSAVWPCF